MFDTAIDTADDHDEECSYKTAGATKTDAIGTRDTAEFFNVGKNDMIVPADQMQRPWPAAILSKQQLCADYCRTAHGVGLMVLHILAAKLGIDPIEISSRHRFEEKAGDHIRITRGPPRRTKAMPEIQTPSHTDFGTYVGHGPSHHDSINLLTRNTDAASPS